MMRIPRMVKDEEMCSAFILVAEYAKNKRLLKCAEADIIKSTPNKPEVMITAQGTTGDPTASKALTLVEPSFKGNGKRLARLKADIEPVERALKELETWLHGDRIRRCIDLVYWNDNGYKSIAAAAETVNMDGSYVGHLLRNFIRRVDHYKFNDD